jgi:hypothetical protein
MTVLPFGAKNADAANILAKLVQSRLEKNANLQRKLRSVRSGCTTIPFEHNPVEELFAMIAKALAFQYFGIRLGSGYSSLASFFANEGEEFFSQMLSTGKKHVSGDFGDGFQVQTRAESRRSAIDHVAI